MLRDTKSPPLRSSTLRRATVIALTLGAGVFVAGLRPPESEQALAQETAKPQAEQGPAQDKASGGFNLESVPGSTKVLIGLRPAQIASRPEMAPLVKVINESIEADKTGIRFEDIDQVLMIVAGPVRLDAGTQLIRGPVFEVRMAEPTDFTAYAENQKLISNDGLRGLNADPDAPPLTAEQRKMIRESEVHRQQFLAGIREEETEGAIDIVDERTMRYGTGKDLWALLDDLDRISDGRPDWAEAFEKVADDHACIVGDVAAFRSFFETQFQRQPNPMAGLFVPLWKNTNLAIGSVRIDDELPITVHAWASDADSAAKLEQALLALVPLGRGMLESGKASILQEPEDLRRMMQQSITLAESALDNLTIQTDEDHVTLSVTTDGGLAPLTTLVTAFVPAIQSAREAARRSQAQNDLKQIGLALHNYHDVHGHFPTPSVYGRNADGKSEHPHSWRVALLPFLDQIELYDNYHFDQPWDSAHNKTILQQMPDVFRHPTDDANSANTPYFALVGDHTGLGNRPEPGQQPGGTGVRVQDITDGLSNTLLIVEAKRDIPWTKPEDIPYAPDADLPNLGGHWDLGADGFFALFADGAVRYVANSVDETMLRNLITRDDGNSVPIGPAN